ncbi:MAG: hypothetical protein ACRD51_10065 [Candidatus Acidiferrum sp.]
MAVPKMRGSRHGLVLAFSKKRGWLCVAALTAALCAAAISVRADEIRLKDGKKLYGVIVAYENNMFKVKTDFGYVLVEKDKIASIVPSTPASTAAKTEKTPAAKKAPASDAQPKGEAAAADASAKSAQAAAGKSEKVMPKGTTAAVKPTASANAKTNVENPAKTAASAAPGSTAPASTPTTPAAQPAALKEPEPPPMREAIEGNYYTNYTHGFKMYKAPSWEVIEDARKALPNAIVALGTHDESTLMVIGQEQTKDTLEPAAAMVEKRLNDIYDNYQSISRRKTTVGGLPAVECHYRGTADGHDWSGTLAVIARGDEIFTVLGMTYADTDLIQIQENVIARAIGSLEFNVH